MVILCGKSGSGKDTIGRELEALGYKKAVTYTTRPMREGEREGIDYHFVSEEKFQEMIDAGLFAEHTTFNTVFGPYHYGSLKEDYLGADKTYIILNPYALKMVRCANPRTEWGGAFGGLAFLIEADDALMDRLTARGDSKEEIVRRLAADKEDFEGIVCCIDHIIDNNGTPREAAEEIDKVEREFQTWRQHRA